MTLVTLFVLTVSSSAAGQPATLPDQPLIGSTLDADLLRDLPTSNSPFALFETIQPEVIGDVIASGGLSAATAPRSGAFLNSWTQTQFRIGDVSITDPRSGGTPLLLPILPFWRRVTAATGAMGVEESAPGLSMTLEPLRPGTTWLREIDGSASGPLLVSGASSPYPVVDLMQQWQDGTALVSGPASDRVGVVAAAAWRGLSHVPAQTSSATTDRVASAFAHLVFALTPTDEIRALGWAQRVTATAFTDTAAHVQSTWERRAPGQTSWRVFAAYSERSRTAPVPSSLVVDSLASDPVSDLFDVGAGTDRRWVVGGRVAPSSHARLPSVGIDLESAQVRVATPAIRQIGELIDGMPARLWTVHAGTGTDIRRLTTFAAFGNEHLTYRGLTLDAGLRFDTVSGAADGSARGVQWVTWLPRAVARWHVFETGGLAVVASYRRSAYQLPLNVLAIGDPAAPFADISGWNGTSAGPPIARVGPGSGPTANLTQIDPGLQRPTTDELVLAIEARPVKGLQVELARITKREQPLLGFVDTGVPVSSYTSFQVANPGYVSGQPFGAPLIQVYNRPAGGYGRDQYLLTNQVGDPARSWALELTVRATTDHFTLLAGGALTWALGPAAAVGFLPTENDQDILGNLFVDPNAATLARGQLFPDRSHVVKIAGVYRFPWQVSVGGIARYQDGQPFARVVVVPDLTQGPTAIRAYANGGAAFSYTGTLDVRVQKIFKAGPTQVAGLVDVYNLPNLGNQIAEHIVISGIGFRTPTAQQPPRTIVVGARVTF